MPFSPFVEDNRHAHRPPRKSGVEEEPAFEKLVILAIAMPVFRQLPVILHAPVLQVRLWLDHRVDALVYTLDRRPCRGSEFHRDGFGEIDCALDWIAFAKFNPGGDGLGILQCSLEWCCRGYQRWVFPRSTEA